MDVQTLHTIARQFRDQLRVCPLQEPQALPAGQVETFQSIINDIYQDAPVVEEAAEDPYLTLVDELGYQFEYLTARGVQFIFQDTDPTPINPETGRISARRMFEQVASESNHKDLPGPWAYVVVRVYRSADSDHPVLGRYHVEYRGRTENLNTIFRGVHDFLGHIATAQPFDWNGETRAYYSHKSTFSPLAQLALFCETVGQQCVYAATGDYADPQKAFVTGLAEHLDLAPIIAR